MYCNDFDSVFTKEINEWINRYNMLKNFHITSYGRHYDDLPAKWADILTIIDSNVMKSTKAYRDYKKS